VGLPLCPFVVHIPVIGSSSGRNKEWLDINVGYAGDVMKTATIIGLFPVFLHPCAFISLSL
jgi:hypothetical protein